MKRLGIFIMMAILGALLLGVLLDEFKGSLQASNTAYPLPEGVSIKLTKEFYDALKAEAEAGVKVYSNDPSQQYLRQIAVSSRYMVESNLQILKNQERIIKLLESGKETGTK
jgi:hypothetical protein